MTMDYDGETIEYRWDTTDPDNAGWYAVRYVDGKLIEDSTKATFRCDVDQYESADELAAALRESYPDATVRAA